MQFVANYNIITVIRIIEVNMKKLFSVLLIIIFCCGCANTKVEKLKDPNYEILGHGIEILENTSALAKAYYTATDYTVSNFIDSKVKKMPEFISFEYSSDVKLSSDERKTLQELYSAYDIEITEGLRSSLSEINSGLTVAYASFSEVAIEDCDLTIAVKVYYGNYYYTYTCDFAKIKNEYVLFRFNDLSYARYIF